MDRALRSTRRPDRRPDPRPVRGRAALRPRLSAARRVPAPAPADVQPDRARPALPGGRRRVGGGSAPGVVHPGAGRHAGAGRRAGPRLGLRPGPDPAERGLPPCGGLPLPDLRRPRQRREPGRAPAGLGRRVRRGCVSGVRDAAGAARGHPRRDRRPFDGRDRRDPRGGGRSAGRSRRLRVDAVRSEPHGPPDLPPREAPVPRPGGDPAVVDHDPRVRPPARPLTPVDQRPACRPPLPRADPRRARPGRPDHARRARPEDRLRRPRGASRRARSGAGRAPDRRPGRAQLAVRGRGVPAVGRRLPRSRARRTAQPRSGGCRRRERRRPQAARPRDAAGRGPGGRRRRWRWSDARAPDES